MGTSFLGIHRKLLSHFRSQLLSIPTKRLVALYLLDRILGLAALYVVVLYFAHVVALLLVPSGEQTPTEKEHQETQRCPFQECLFHPK